MEGRRHAADPCGQQIADSQPEGVSGVDVAVDQYRIVHFHVVVFTVRSADIIHVVVQCGLSGMPRCRHQKIPNTAGQKAAGHVWAAASRNAATAVMRS